MKRTCRIFLFVCAFSFVAYSQDPATTAEQQRQIKLEREKAESDRQNSARSREVFERARAQRAVRITMPPKETAEERKEAAERRAEIRNILLPNPLDSARYQAFLRQPNTGLFRLFPDFDCEKNGLVRIDGKCADFISGSSFYSFRRKSYTNDAFFDISLRAENLIVGSSRAQAISVRLGDVPLETISLATSGMKFLTDFKPETKYNEIKKQFLQIARGIESDGWHYAKNVEAAENTTYAIRLIAYRSENKAANRFTQNQPDAAERKHLIVDSDKREDIIVAFRVVRRDADGNLTILWKELSRQVAPKIVYEKNEKLAVIR